LPKILLDRRVEDETEDDLHDRQRQPVKQHCLQPLPGSQPATQSLS
jgi:hypothetical protein